MRTNGALLDVNGEIVASPGKSDVSAAIDRAAQGHVTITRSGGFFLEAAPDSEGSGGLLSLACGGDQKGQRQFATAPVTTAEAKALFSDFLDGGGALAFMLMVWVVPVLLPAALGLALCVFVVWKALQEAQVRRWPQTDGRITASSLEPRRRRFRMEATKLDNIPLLAYEFSVAGRPYVGSRLGLNTEFAGVDVGALVARYPVGAVVPVYYNPSNPNDCLLDPDANRGLSGDALKLFAILGAFFAALYYSASALTHAVAAHFHNANAPHVVFASSAGLTFLLLFAWSFRPRSRTAAAPRASGTIVKSEVEEVWEDSAGGGSYCNWRPTIEVAYSVGGQNYVLRTRVGEGIGAQTKEEAQERLAPYPVGTTANILYSQNNPGESSLEGDLAEIADDPTQTSYRVAALACAFACFVMATIALGVL